ncbi:MAG TPA: thioesterase family protein [Solirubrobacteraceae bacterium]
MTSTTTDAVFLAAAEGFVPTGHARGPWDPAALHGGAPAALITAAFERLQPGAELQIARLGFELLRPIPFAPLTLSTRIVRPGRRVQELACELHSGDQLVCRASALRVQPVPEGLPELEPPELDGGQPRDGRASMPGPDAGTPVIFALDGASGESFAASAMEMRWLEDPRALGPARVWMRLRHPLLEGEPPSPLARLAATADFGNGVSAALPFDRYVFINADLMIHLLRPPRGEWIGLHARTLLHGGGSGLAESVLHDVRGVVGRAFQTLVVEPR